eukprot:gnl/Trimastix_PCT/3430.p1 GENE.gnl/Trimastix_PCT/3430~~gnl/Trimastix_PCT/3430.p1  ORF type:complete len:492 (+),score=91.86 gnl/Trimastix_PCT/3430:157-1632(+)
MNEQLIQLSEPFIGSRYASRALQSRKKRENLIRSLLAQRRLPDKGWKDGTIEAFLSELSMMDSNNSDDNVGSGEREGRVFNDIVAKRHFYLSHGIGRSGDLCALQPKAVGSSLLYQLTNCLVLDLIKRMGVRSARRALVMPLATGMTLHMVLMHLRTLRPHADCVLWPRMDQKTCLKCILSAGLRAVVVPNVIEGDEVRTDMQALRHALEENGADRVLCVLTTTSCFAPRTPDRVVQVAELCKNAGVPHIVNNAYGIQADRCLNLIETATRRGRLDAFIMSTDKNFMVPVGGGIVASSDAQFIEAISQSYPGRASVAPILDVLITLLSMGFAGYRELVQSRVEVMAYMRAELQRIAAQFGERVLETPNNPIAMGMTLGQLGSVDPVRVGAALYAKCVTGPRVVTESLYKAIGPHEFTCYGAHVTPYPACPYLSCACAIGMTRSEVQVFVKRLTQVLTSLHKAAAPVRAPPSESPNASPSEETPNLGAEESK